MPFSTAALGIFHFDTCHLLGVKQAGVESRFVRSFCFKTLLRENETCLFSHHSLQMLFLLTQLKEDAFFLVFDSQQTTDFYF